MSNISLDDRLSTIGIRLSKAVKLKRNLPWVDIEKTIHAASLEIPHDGRLLSLLCSWILVHGDRAIVEKLMRLQKLENSPWLVALAIFAENQGFHKWGRLIRKQKSEQFLVDRELALSSIELKGEEPGMRKQNFLIPLGSIRAREKDALSTPELARANRQYRNRLLYGAAIRSDIISAIEFGFDTPYSVAKAVGCSYEPAHRVFNEYRIVSELRSS